MLDPNDPTVRTAVFGKQVEDFLQGDIGKYLVHLAEEEAERANEELKRVWPWRTRRIRYLQNVIWRAESIQQWLADAIIAGEQSIRALEGNDEQV